MKVIFIIKNNQYLANVGDNIIVKKLNKKIGEKISLKKILMISNKEKIIIGKPFIKKEYILAKIKAHKKNKKINIIKFKRRKHHIKRQGHRQKYTIIKIIKIKK
ncbi:50S ribosomal protein L21 [Buchnera aphidicola]|uniref:50S ribosomal protein L21 n=1 Tax=Buchnera aphidicola TaxID=9 RepID=UPI0031B8B22F